ncbi:undecaprenyl-phosphate glucose phosphotransferase [Candidatus Nitrosacidococcus tergens]|uniref:Putative UDP-sugar lipid carrier transferase n=1 Tax=Candidatus Nitrosacidococcus tergens TaxID=553981 RepID=A0A7G1QA79_9GAMM|nr:undecaprenyl-phosphate glucose phosphotransferase [Candidatus Nitrosacidococcus tergens]CAB1275828.1 putative UDP-sugar lipid carrier transferase [Candidatus Nitrosacidococcus tergens]
MAIKYPYQQQSLLFVYDALVIFAAACFAYRMYLGTWLLASEYYFVVGVSTLLTAIVFPQFGLYEFKLWHKDSVLDGFKSIILGWGSVLLALILIAFITKTGDKFSRGWALLWAVIGWGGLLAERFFWHLSSKWFIDQRFYRKQIILVGSLKSSLEVIERIQSSPWLSIEIIGFFCENPEVFENEFNLPVVGHIKEAANFIEREKISQAWIAISFEEGELIKEFIQNLHHSTVDLCLIPNIYDFYLLNYSISEIAGLPVLNLSATPITGINIFVKDIEDKVLAFLIVLLISPLLLVIAIGIKLSSPGPIIFKQKRHGLGAAPITMYKFRSMHIHKEERKVTQATKGDSRIFPFGAFLRKTSLDELPQFFNVLEGTMSIVGPRPHAIEHNDEYKQLIGGYMQRHKIKPGITGWAQINGWRGETDTLEKMKKRVEYDLYYIENWSFWFDMKIILTTLYKGFIHRNAY